MLYPATRETRSLSLMQEMEAFLAGRVADGHYPSMEDALRAALALLRQEQASPAEGPRAGQFRRDLDASLRGLTDPPAILAGSLALLGRHLGAIRLLELQNGPEGLAFGAGWTAPGSAPGAAPAMPLPALAGLAATAGQPQLLAEGRLACAPLEACAAVPTLLLAEAPAGRRWSAAEAALLAETAARIGEALRHARVEIALLESEERYRTLFEACPFAIIIIDPVTHQVLDVNEDACRSYGYPREAFLRLNIADIDIRGSKEAIRAHARAATVRPGVQQFETRHRTSSGEIRDVLVRVQGAHLDGRNVTYGAHVDITDRKAAEAALRSSDARLRLALEAARLGTWEFDLRAGQGSRAGPLAETLTNVPPSGFALEAWLEPMHPDDRAMTRRLFEQAVRGEAPRFAAEFRVRRPDGSWIWISSFGAVVERDPATGEAMRIAGVAQDCTERKLAEERQALLTREVDHRAKNALAVVQAALRLTRAPDIASYRQAVEGRVAALARAQTLLAEDQWTGADLRALLEGELRPFLPGPGQRLLLEGPPLRLPPRAAQPLAMAIHELATNATKHGALSEPEGCVAITWEVGPAAAPVLRLRWTESGGPSLPGHPERRGFGTRVLEGTMRAQLGGAVTLSWDGPGLVCDLALPLATPPAAAAD
jgi:PAS domain S-box-containing protein